MKIYCVKSMGGTPFGNEYTIGLLANAGFSISTKPANSDVFVSLNYKRLLPYVLRYPQKIHLVWTNEPRFDTVFREELKMPLNISKIIVMNVYGGDVFWHNYHFLGSYHFDNSNDLGIDIKTKLKNQTKSSFALLNKKNRVAAIYNNTLSTKGKLIFKGLNIDLRDLRCNYAINGYKRDIVDVFGNNWPHGMAKDNFGYGFEKSLPWWLEKIRQLKKYKYNMCLENTSYKHYITEKIWQSVLSYSLPVYSSFYSNIYDTFPKGSFIDVNDFSDATQLFDYIEQMDIDEHLERLNKCIDAYNYSITNYLPEHKRNPQKVVEKIVKKLNSL